MKDLECSDEHGLLWRGHMSHNDGRRNEPAQTDKQSRGVMEAGACPQITSP